MRSLLVLFFSYSDAQRISDVRQRYAHLEWVAPFEGDIRVYVVSIPAEAYDAQRAALEREREIALVSTINAIRFSPRETV